MATKKLDRKVGPPIKAGCVRVFVYGTLKRGHGNCERFLSNNADAEFIREDTTRPHYRLYAPSEAYFPYCADVCGSADTGLRVVGEVWEVGPATLRRLDGLEGYPGHYNRSRVELESGETGVWYYHIDPERIAHMSLTGACWPDGMAARK